MQDKYKKKKRKKKMSLMGQEAKKDCYHEIEYLVPRLMIQILFGRLSMLRVLALGWLGSGVLVLLAAEAGLGAMLGVSGGQPGLCAQYQPPRSAQSTAKVQHHTICCVQPVPAGGWHSAASTGPSRSSNCCPSQALELPVQEYLSSVRS